MVELTGLGLSTSQAERLRVENAQMRPPGFFAVKTRFRVHGLGIESLQLRVHGLGIYGIQFRV